MSSGEETGYGYLLRSNFASLLTTDLQIGVIGFPGRTKPRSRDVGELSIFARDVVLLTPCLHQVCVRL